MYPASKVASISPTETRRARGSDGYIQNPLICRSFCDLNETNFILDSFICARKLILTGVLLTFSAPSHVVILKKTINSAFSKLRGGALVLFRNATNEVKFLKNFQLIFVQLNYGQVNFVLEENLWL